MAQVMTTTPQDAVSAECAGLAATYPARTRQGLVAGFYCVNPLTGAVTAGPFATPAEAEAHRTWTDKILTGVVHTSSGRPVREARP
ncbi:hypothetical protein [Zhihengliuella halotolerans]|uniref:hypothetical protein n=1 Tax=Zhihengliuella halotolerans TaxID=370736 RepID=UPI000C7F8A68|nr:hypothetical protein [Zhihengliuella halotolerans]